MNRRLLIRLTLFSLVILMASGLSAQATRTWVSGVGDDVNPCSRTAPCKTWAGAISKTAAGGEMNALDPGGYGALTITKSMTVDGNAQHASSLNSGVNGFVINDSLSGTPNTIKVNLRNLAINGAGITPGVNGIRILAGREVNVENVFIVNERSTSVGAGRGIDIQMSGTATMDVTLRNVTITNTQSHAVAALPSSGTPTVKLTVRNCSFTGNIGGNGDAFFLGNGVTAAIADSSISGYAAAGIETFGNAQVTVERTVISSSTRGLFASDTSRIRIGHNTIVNNATAGFVVNGSSLIESWGDNHFANNGPDIGVLTSIAINKK
ncbi:MAG TPA: right-handed parallel beta-helix repeat-containing protein [Thermoanaerobaculia bacterium]|nr:right-handed parallel beta-helix repeat-containing protein [Thermoanaerobaculia bacterium]